MGDDASEFARQLRAVLGDVSPARVDALYDKFRHSPDRVTYAIDSVLGGSRRAPKSYPAMSFEQPADRKRTRSSTTKRVKAEPKIEPKKDQIGSLAVKVEPKIESVEPMAILDKKPVAAGWSRYIGTLYSDAWATRPYMSALPYLTPLTVRRLTPKRLVGTAKPKESAVIRLYAGADDRELGRLKEDLTRVLAPLLDLDLVDFRAYVMLETARLSIADPFYIKIDCYIRESAFAPPTVPETSKSTFGFGAETDAEAKLRQRQYAVSRLFDKLELRPVGGSGGSEPGDDGDLPEDSSELSLDQMKAFYSAQQSDVLDYLPDTTTPKEFGLSLRSYQRHGLSWMLAREKELEVLKECSDDSGFNTQSISDIQTREDGVMNPLWRTFKWPNSEEDDSFVGTHFYANLYSGELSLDKPLIKSQLRGGILADEMGLGKTISTLALVNAVPYDSETAPRYAHKTTLVVVPMSLLSQWQNEFNKTNTNPNHVCIVHYGDQAGSDLAHSLMGQKKTPVLVLTTYGTVLSEFTKLEKKRDAEGRLPKVGLYSVKFFRIIIDEGHNIRNRTAKTSRAIFDLASARKWVLTGTPVINRLDDLYSLVKFLQLEPWNNFSYWKTFITLPFENKQVAQTLDVVKTILEPIFLRRTKDMKGPDGQPLVSLPPKEVTVEEVKFTDRELVFYEWFRDRASRSFKDSLRSGEVLKKYAQILTHILRLRQICCHVNLVGAVLSDMEEEVDATMDEDIKQIQSLFNSDEKFKNETKTNTVLYSVMGQIHVDDAECSICTTSPIPLNEMVVTECGHMFCHSCLLEHIEFQHKQKQQPQCPNCRHQISKYRLFKVVDKETHKNEYKFHTGKVVNDNFKFKLLLYDPDQTSSKIQALTNHLNALKSQGNNESIIVFSQFSSFLDIIQNELKLQISGIKCLKFDGRLKLNEREQLLDEFNRSSNDPNQLTVLLLSLKAGGVGLNLTNASRAFMMDPWWSPSIEDQAIDRLHRIGQTKHVKVTRFIMENSIENKMLKIQERKKQIGEAVGVEEEEKRRRRIEEIKTLLED